MKKLITSKIKYEIEIEIERMETIRSIFLPF